MINLHYVFFFYILFFVSDRLAEKITIIVKVKYPYVNVSSVSIFNSIRYAVQTTEMCQRLN